MALDHLINPTAKEAPQMPTHLRRGYDNLDPQLTDYSWKKAKRSKLSRRDQAELGEVATWLVNLATTTAAATDKESNFVSTSLKIPNSYMCTVCGKAFPTYQALGGHKSSHRVKPLSSAVLDDVIDELHVFRYKASDMKLHECKICHKNFPTGQALGGHKRKHFEGVIAAKSHSLKSGVTYDGGAASPTGVAVVRDFDLNLPPPPDLYCDEEVESSLPPLFG